MALVALATIERDKALAGWRTARGEDLVAYQAKYNLAQGIIDMVLKAPHEFKQQQ